VQSQGSQPTTVLILWCSYNIYAFAKLLCAIN
jgi:hypothetical protein